MTYEEFKQKWDDVETFEDELEMAEDAFNMYEETGFLETLDSPYDDLESKNGMKFKVLRRLSYVTDDVDLECLPMWEIELENGELIHCYPEEICKLEKQK
jgi:hypothetical protein